MTGVDMDSISVCVSYQNCTLVACVLYSAIFGCSNMLMLCTKSHYIIISLNEYLYVNAETPHCL